MELADRVHMVEVQLGRRILYLYLFVGDVTVLLDTGMSQTPNSELLAYLSVANVKPEDISIAINTHCDADHFGGNAGLKNLSPRTLLLAHELDSELIEDPEMTMKERYLQFEERHSIILPSHVKVELRSMMGLPTRLDVLLRGGEEIRIDDSRRLRVLHAPGHSKGHIALHDPRERALYIGDAILWRYIPNRYGEPALPPSYLYPTEYLDTIRLFMSMKPDHIYTAHYRPMEGDDANRFLQESLEFAQELEATILQIHREFREPLTLKQVIQEVFNIYKIWPEEAKWDLAYPISGHLNSLVSRGLIKAVRRNGLPAWVAV